MIGWLTLRREIAGVEWLEESRLARLLSPTPLASHAAFYARRARRRLRFWDALLDGATAWNRRHDK